MEKFSALLAFCAGNSPVTGEFPARGPVTRSFDVFFDLDGWANNGDAGDLSCYRANYDVIVMLQITHVKCFKALMTWLSGRTTVEKTTQDGGLSKEVACHEGEIYMICKEWGVEMDQILQH